MTDTLTFSAALRERTSAAHSDSETAGFMADLMKGTGTREDYVALVAQHWFMYDAIEDVAEVLAADATASAFITDALSRRDALAVDLTALLGDDWRAQIAPLPATARYAARIREMAAWPGGFIAHHYTRYLGDLSGGQFIGKLMARRFELGREGVSFYIFDDIADPAAFKEQYRAALDAAPWDAAERERILDEVLVAYRFNTEVFEDLAAAKAATV